MFTHTPLDLRGQCDKYCVRSNSPVRTVLCYCKPVYLYSLMTVCTDVLSFDNAD